MAAPLRIIDFHNHFVGPRIPLTTLAANPPALRPLWEEINRRLSDPAALLASIEEAGIAARVVNTPAAFIEDADGNVPAGTYERINDHLAELAARHPGRIHALASVDAFSGEAGARELMRAVRELGLRGAFVESAKGDKLLDVREARPTLAAAAALGIPVFVHPVNDRVLHPRLKGYGRLGVLLARGTVNSASLLAMLEGGVFDELPGLNVVVTTLALGGLLMAGSFGDRHHIRSDAPALARRHVYVDTMSIDPAAIRAAVALLGADHVVMGTDWPVFVESDVEARLSAALTAAGLDRHEQQMVAGGNTLRLLGLG